MRRWRPISTSERGEKTALFISRFKELLPIDAGIAKDLQRSLAAKSPEIAIPARCQVVDVLNPRRRRRRIKKLKQQRGRLLTTIPSGESIRIPPAYRSDEAFVLRRALSTLIKAPMPPPTPALRRPGTRHLAPPVGHRHQRVPVAAMPYLRA